MEYNRNNAIKDFVCRTKYNLELYLKNNKENEGKYPYEVTQILNSFLGIIVLPKEKENYVLASIDISNLQNKIQIEQNKDATTFFRHLRNSVSHGNFLNNMDIDQRTKEIKQITFKDFIPHNGLQTFEITLSIAEIKQIIEKIASEYTKLP